MSDNVVQVDNLFVRYGKVEEVRGISFEIPQGEVFGFIGPNGAGKSSTIKVLATLMRDFDGQALVKGIDVRQRPFLVRETIGYMPDFFGVYDDLTVKEYLYFFAAAYRLPMLKRANIVADVLELTDLTDKLNAPVDSLSRGMKQRLALARVLLHDPELLLFAGDQIELLAIEQNRVERVERRDRLTPTGEREHAYGPSGADELERQLPVLPAAGSQHHEVDAGSRGGLTQGGAQRLVVTLVKHPPGTELCCLGTCRGAPAEPEHPGAEPTRYRNGGLSEGAESDHRNVLPRLEATAQQGAVGLVEQIGRRHLD